MKNRDQGSVLVETLVATAIVSLMTAALFSALGEAASRSRELEARRLALMTARSVLAVGMTGNASGAGRVTGVDGAFAWELTAAPAAGGAPSASGGLVRLEVRVRDRTSGDPLARLATLRLAEGV